MVAVVPGDVLLAGCLHRAQFQVIDGGQLGLAAGGLVVDPGAVDAQVVAGMQAHQPVQRVARGRAGAGQRQAGDAVEVGPPAAAVGGAGDGDVAPRIGQQGAGRFHRAAADVDVAHGRQADLVALDAPAHVVDAAGADLHDVARSDGAGAGEASLGMRHLVRGQDRLKKEIGQIDLERMAKKLALSSNDIDAS